MEQIIMATPHHNQSKQNRLNFVRNVFVRRLKMSSVLKKLKRSKNNAREFQITASVEALTLECQKEVWHPHKIVIVWDKNNSSWRTKPVPWQPGVNNAFRGIHVWPEPDPVQMTSKLYKNPQKNGTYEDHLWDIVIKNESESGRRKVIATGSIDLADYISETEKAFDITVSLKPANKNVITGSMEFTLTSVMLEDGIPYCNKEDMIRELLRDASAKSTSSAEKATKKLHAGKGTGADTKNNDGRGAKKVKRRKAPPRSRLPPTTNPQTPAPPAHPVEDCNIKELKKSTSSTEKPTKKLHAGKGTDADIKNNDGLGAKKVQRRKAPPRSRLPPTTSPQTPVPAAHPVEECKIKELKSSAVLKNNNEQKTSNNVDTSASNRGNGRRKKLTKRRPKKSNLSSTSSEDERPLSSKSASPSKKKTVEVRERGTTKVTEKVDVEEKVASPLVRRRKRRGIKKAVKKLNPFRGRSDEKSDLPSSKDCKEPKMKKLVLTKATEQEFDEETFSSPGSISAVTVLLKKNVVISKPEVDDGAWGGDERSVSSEADNRIVIESGGSATDQRKATATGTVKTAGTDAAVTEREKEKLACFFNKLLKPVSHKAPQYCPDLSAYVAEELIFLKEEIVSLDKVILKVELEMQQAMNITDCKDELDGLMQDWLLLNDYRAELASRKSNLLILDKQDDFEQCCNILRSELKLLFQLEDWRKTAHHRAQEARLLDFLLTFVNKRRENC